MFFEGYKYRKGKTTRQHSFIQQKMSTVEKTQGEVVERINHRTVFTRPPHENHTLTAWYKCPTRRQSVMSEDEVRRREQVATVYRAGWDERLLQEGFAETIMICDEEMSEIVWMVDMLRSAAYLGCSVGSLEKAFINYRDMTRIPVSYHDYLIARGYTAHREVPAYRRIADVPLACLFSSSSSSFREKEKEKEVVDDTSSSSSEGEKEESESDPEEVLPPPMKRFRPFSQVDAFVEEAEEARFRVETVHLRNKTIIWYPWGLHNLEDQQEISTSLI